MKTTHTATPWELSTIENEVALTGRNGIETICDYDIILGKANAKHIVKCVNAHDALTDAVNKAIAMTLDNVVGQAIKDGSLLQEEMHAGLCLLGYIRRKALKTYEQALLKAEA